MLTLDVTTKKLEFVLGAAHTTNAVEASVFYYNVPRQSIDRYTEFLPSSFHVASNGTTTVTLLAAPPNAVVSNVNHIAIHNKDTITQTVTVKLDFSATEYILVKVALLTLETLIYESGNGWQVI